MTIQRLPDWEARLHDYLAACERATFAWGTLDCVLFSAGAVLAMTGVDPAAAARGHYTTAIGSVRALRRYGDGTLIRTLNARFARQPIGFAKRGDLVMVDGMVGVCIGADAVFVGENDGVAGLVRFPRATWSRAWVV